MQVLQVSFRNHANNTTIASLEAWKQPRFQWSMLMYSHSTMTQVQDFTSEALKMASRSVP